MIEDGTPLADLRDALTAFARSRHDHPVMVDIAVVLWEETSMDDDGTVGRAIQYAIPTDNFGLAASLGLLTAGRHYMAEDLFGEAE